MIRVKLSPLPWKPKMSKSFSRLCLILPYFCVLAFTLVLDLFLVLDCIQAVNGFYKYFYACCLSVLMLRIV